jgi:hypothetical protein
MSCSAGGTSHCGQGRRGSDEGRTILLKGTRGTLVGAMKEKSNDPGLDILAALAAVHGDTSDSSRGLVVKDSISIGGVGSGWVATHVWGLRNSRGFFGRSRLL